MKYKVDASLKDKYLLRQYPWSVNDNGLVIVYERPEKELLLNNQLFSDLYINADGSYTVDSYLEGVIGKMKNSGKDFDAQVIVDIIIDSLNSMVDEGLIRLEDIQFMLPSEIYYKK